MVSIGILAVSLTAISELPAEATPHGICSRRYVAILLARSKMIDLEEELWKDGFPDDEKEFDGEFDKEVIQIFDGSHRS